MMQQANIIHHVLPGIAPAERQQQIRSLIRSGDICWAGNKKLRIYGRLSCNSGKRMQPVNRVFFSSEAAARANGYRPCGHCLRDAYRQWKAGAH